MLRSQPVSRGKSKLPGLAKSAGDGITNMVRRFGHVLEKTQIKLVEENAEDVHDEPDQAKGSLLVDCVRFSYKSCMEGYWNGSCLIALSIRGYSALLGK